VSRSDHLDVLDNHGWRLWWLNGVTFYRRVYLTGPHADEVYLKVESIAPQVRIRAAALNRRPDNSVLDEFARHGMYLTVRRDRHGKANGFELVDNQDIQFSFKLVGDYDRVTDAYTAVQRPAVGVAAGVGASRDIVQWLSDEALAIARRMGLLGKGR
jgi:hypothetical protein